MAEIKEALVPDIGDYSDVPVIEVLVSVGDTVSKDQSLVTLESDKATMEVPSSVAGVVKEIKVKVGDSLSQGALVALIEVADAGAETAAAPAPAAAPAKAAPAAAPAPAAKAAPAAASEGGQVEARVPDIGDYSGVPVIEVLVAVGDTVAKDQSLVTLESDKATMEVPSSVAGVIKELKVKVGDSLSQGDLVAIIAASDGGAGAAQSPAKPTTDTAETAGKVEPVAVPAEPDKLAQREIAQVQSARSTAASQPAQAASGTPSSPPVTFDADSVLPSKVPYASPVVRVFARELGVDLNQIKGSEKGGRITREDVQRFVKAALSGGAPAAAGAAPAGGGNGLNLLAWPKVDFSKFGETETQPLSRIKKISGANLARNWAMIPHVTQFESADITDLEALRVALNKENEKAGIKLTMLAFLIKASAAALKKFPEFNASLDAAGENLTLKKYINIGFAADTPNGLVVPVIRDVDKKGVLQIAQESGELAKKARDGKLGPADMSGGCFSISSLGGIGGTAFTPIINAPEVAILGVSKSAMQPVWNGKDFAPKLMLPLSLSYDHRVIDGALAARFTTYLSQVLADMRRVLL
ncbi:dihydrolipoyllysine-residue acetyltransferase [Xanthomonas campestris pv. campestris]|uniref:Acetyltransferase component of pyruvate dehydrogenase complex n=1 Tax=Xanthomonas campestris pv. campestris (strain B100) TaxID=509169 RepID=B0RWD4_XANCB|nr:dihydrolipoyllysine-residue acetyltransferase [Xanthomonas campestris]MCD0248469.1 dihydrolipoyllysine-residue acetyltransferase [Xanthomonas campestris pv. campestris]MCD0261011.1 dihydrolipoyllysine-residue acetyltransferase [Xanthomonas campestris pv. campestris]MCD0269340.1 dihydrolipoyllysine-residue acetyltransferase [Xanthomonas campestris pv. campestris]MCF8798582.1 dihydrolipoyllysine-residue acetyltransferase [Xanthomonas campestris pv. campestris]MCF8814358.1 dihydrolipoyllysine-